MASKIESFRPLKPSFAEGRALLREAQPQEGMMTDWTLHSWRGREGSGRWKGEEKGQRGREGGEESGAAKETGEECSE